MKGYKIRGKPLEKIFRQKRLFRQSHTKVKLPFFRNGQTYLVFPGVSRSLQQRKDLPTFTTDFGLVVISPQIHFSKSKRVFVAINGLGFQKNFGVHFENVLFTTHSQGVGVPYLSLFFAFAKLLSLSLDVDHSR